SEYRVKPVVGKWSIGNDRLALNVQGHGKSAEDNVLYRRCRIWHVLKAGLFLRQVNLGHCLGGCGGYRYTCRLSNQPVGCRDNHLLTEVMGRRHGEEDWGKTFSLEQRPPTPGRGARTAGDAPCLILG